jgi:type III pantothenate kinase
MDTLVIDIGNTTIASGIYRSGSVSRVRRFATSSFAAKDIESFLTTNAPARVSSAVAASVVPRRTPAWRNLLRKRFGKNVVWVDHKTELGVRITHSNPNQIGADRLANTAGGAAKYGSRFFVIDIGTAITFDIVVPRRGYIGGVIAPGGPVMRRALSERAALLPEVDLHPTRARIGRSTEEAMRLGIQIGERGMVREILDHLTRYYGGPDLRLIATGGDADHITRGLDRKIVLDPDLTLYGLGVIGKLNLVE